MSLLRAGARRVASATKTSLAVVGFATSLASLSLLWQTKTFVTEELKEKKRVLVLPFHSLKLVDRPDRLSWLQSQGNNSSVQEIEVQDLVNVIHEAASDPSIVAIFGEFGHGRSFSAGAADSEEIRNALRVFRESHRFHNEPNLAHEPVLQRNSNSSPRPLYAYADTFESPGRPENPDYFIASIFTHIHLQKQGQLNLFGHSSSVPFFQKALEKYGAKVHVYKHGPFKNAPNTFTENGFTKPHKENVETYLFALNNYMFDDIASARRGLQLSGDMWKLIQNSGTFTCSSSKKMGFVDYSPERSPLEALLESNKQGIQEEERQALKVKWGSNTDLESFPADEQVSLSDYRTIVSKRKRLEAYRWRAFQHFKEAAVKHSVVGSILGLLGYPAPFFNFSENEFDKDKANALSEKIALIKINGTIDGGKVRKLAPSLKKIKNDNSVKCVVVRVNSPGGTIDASEALLQELKDLPQSVVFSFGNVSASGGYYIASAADHIFASKSTLTGSIGVYGLRFDLSGVAQQYDVKFDHISTSDMALANNIFYPCTKQMHANSARSVDRAYQRFKEVVTTGRAMQEDYLDTIAGGRVWTGEQAKHNGLVDEIGGLQRAIAYARRTYTSGDASVESYAEEDAYFDRFRKLFGQGLALVASSDKPTGFRPAIPSNLQSVSPGSLGGVMPFPFVLPNRAFGVFLSVDENTAIQSLLNSEADGEAEQ